jgi:GntR family transcriptional regulator, uxu operon transcriptional repressor
MPNRIYRDVARLLIDDLRASSAAPGSRLPSERALAERYRVSRATVREALVALELAGAVQTHGGSGTFIVDLAEAGGDSPAPPAVEDESPTDIMQARLVLEPVVARLAAARWDRSALAQIARPLRAVERAAQVSSLDVHPGQADRQFHAAIAAACCNPVVTRVMEPLYRMMAQNLWEGVKQQQWTAALTVQMAAEHLAIYEAIQARDPDRAAFEAERHIRNVIATIFAD